MFLLSRLSQHRLLLNKKYQTTYKNSCIATIQEFFIYLHPEKQSVTLKTNTYYVKSKIYSGKQGNRYRTPGS